MEYTYSFEKLEVWQMSRELVKKVYIITSLFPADEKFGLTSQMRRAAISVSSSIADGSSRWGKNDKARFYEIAYGSLIEILTQLILAGDLGYIDLDEIEKNRPKIDSIGRMLDALRKSTKF